MSVNELIIEILNCIAESSIIIFYLYNMMKESFRVRKRAIFPATLLTSMILAAVTLFFEYPWINLIATFVLMTAVSNIMFEYKFGKKLFCSLIFLIVILASESLPMGILYILYFGSSLD